MLSAIVVLLYFTPFFSGFIVDFQQVNVNWAESKKIKMKKKKKKKKKPKKKKKKKKKKIKYMGLFLG